MSVLLLLIVFFYVWLDGLKNKWDLKLWEFV